MPFLAHLKELRKYLLRSAGAVVAGFLFSFVFYQPIVQFLSKPFHQLAASGENALFVNAILEGFITKVKISLLSGLVLSSPLHLWHAVRFVFPALHPHEKKIISYTLCASFLLVLLGSFYTYDTIIPFSVQFLTSSGVIPSRVGLLLNYGSNVLFVFQFLLIALALFQLPVVLELLLAMQVVKRKTLLRHHRSVVVGILVLAAILTPPDPISLLSLALPLCTLFYLTLLVAKLARFGEDGA